MKQLGRDSTEVVDEAAIGRAPFARLSTHTWVVLAVALCAPIVCHFALVRPAADSLSEAHRALEAAVRDELASTLEYRRSRAAAAVVESRAESLAAELQRMRGAEASVQAQLRALGERNGRGIEHTTADRGDGDWMPHGLPMAQGHAAAS
jgi:hypothetical protein